MRTIFAFRIDPIQLSDTGRYTCSATNALGTASTSCDVFVDEGKTTRLMINSRFREATCQVCQRQCRAEGIVKQNERTRRSIDACSSSDWWQKVDVGVVRFFSSLLLLLFVSMSTTKSMQMRIYFKQCFLSLFLFCVFSSVAS